MKKKFQVRPLIASIIGLLLLAPLVFQIYEEGFLSIFEIHRVIGGNTFFNPATLGLFGFILVCAGFYPKFQEYRWKKEMIHKKEVRKQSEVIPKDMHLENSIDRPIIKLIQEYIAYATYMCSLFEQHYKNLDEDGFWRSYRLKIIPKEGYMGEVYFSFHGAGCYFKSPNDEIDVDFGPNTSCDRFDLMRLRQFLSHRKDKYPTLISDSILEEEFSKLQKEDVITKLEYGAGSHLYYFKKDLNSLSGVTA
jgi:hypothetical protein